MTVKVGLIGAGGIAGAHLKGYAAIPQRAEVTAVADVVESAAQARAEQVGGAEVFDSITSLLAGADVDAIDICLPHHLHADAIVAAAEAGKQILCEKPLCISLDEAERVKSAVKASGVTLMCAHNQLYMPPVAKARSIIESGALGTIYQLRTTDCFYNRGLSGDMGWRSSVDTAGGGELIDTGYHPTYLLLHLAQSVPVAVTAMTSLHRLPMQAEDSAQVLVRFEDGSVGNIVTSWAYALPEGSERFSVIGSDGTLWSDGRRLSHRVDGQTTVYDFPGEGVDTFVAEIADFIDCVESGRRPINTEVEGIHVLEVILGAYTSVEESRIVTMSRS